MSKMGWGPLNRVRQKLQQPAKITTSWPRKHQVIAQNKCTVGK